MTNSDKMKIFIVFVFNFFGVVVVVIIVVIVVVVVVGGCCCACCWKLVSSAGPSPW